jgi:predicted porin
VPGSPGRDQIWSAGANYARSNLTVAAGYLNARNPNFGFFAENPNGSATGNNLGSVGSATAPERNPVYAGYASANTQQIFIAGAAYRIAATTLGVVYSNTRFSNLGSNSLPNMFQRGSTAMFNDVEINLKYQFTPALFAGFAYNWTRGASEIAGGAGVTATYNQFAGGADYALSKRTDVYFVAIYQHASGTDSLGQPAVASLASLTPSANANQIAACLALRTRF